jgi:hypothetical protein
MKDLSQQSSDQPPLPLHALPPPQQYSMALFAILGVELRRLMECEGNILASLVSSGVVYS